MADTNPSRVLSAPGAAEAQSPLRGLQPLCELRGLLVYALRLSEQPELVRHITRLRAEAFGEGGPWNYGLDEHDRLATQLIACEASEPVGALRLCLGGELTAQRGLAAFYLNTGWTFEPRAESFFSTALEYGRFWVRPGHPRTPSILNALLSALGTFAELHPEYRAVFGTVSLLDYGTAPLALIADYLRRFHLPPVRWLQPRRPFGGGAPPPTPEPPPAGPERAQAYRALVRGLKEAVPSQSLPFLLHLYLRQGAQLLGDVALDDTGRKLLIPLCVDMPTFQDFAARLRRSAGAAAP